MALLPCGGKMITAAAGQKKGRRREYTRILTGPPTPGRAAPSARSQCRMSDRYYEDFAVGEIKRPRGRVRVEKDAIIAFAQKFDPQPFHLDDESGRKSIFGRMVASGWHTAALTMGLVAASEYRAVTGTIGMGFDAMLWPIPVYPGDELRIETEVLEMRPSKTRPDRGVMKFRTRTLNQNDEVVQELIANAMVPRRPAATVR
jgi:acyl dehydratase